MYFTDRLKQKACQLWNSWQAFLDAKARASEENTPCALRPSESNTTQRRRHMTTLATATTLIEASENGPGEKVVKMQPKKGKAMKAPTKVERQDLLRQRIVKLV